MYLSAFYIDCTKKVMSIVEMSSLHCLLVLCISQHRSQRVVAIICYMYCLSVSCTQNHWKLTPLSLQVYYSALNFKDIMLATNKLSPIFLDGQKEEECFQGFEFAGRNKR